MPRFKGIVQSVTLSAEDMHKLLTMPLDGIDDWSPVRVVIVPDEKALYEKFARSIADKIKANNEQGRLTKLILTFGPIGQYPILAKMCNRENISWKNVWIFNIDQYLDWEGRPLPEEHPLSYRGQMKRLLFNRLRKDLSPPEEQVWYPDPFNPDAIEEKIDELGGIDTAYDGIGLHGHTGFNEPIDTYFLRLTPEEFKKSKTRVVELNPDTLTEGLIDGIMLPPRAITLGMRVILEAKTIEIYTLIQKWMFRIACMHPPTLDYPVTFLQEHPDPKNTVTICTARKIRGMT